MDGQKFDYRGCWRFPIHTSAGRFVGAFAISRHLEGQVRRQAQEWLRESEQRYRESEARFRTLAEPFVQAVWETDAKGVGISNSASWRAYTGQTLEEWLGEGWVNAVVSSQADCRAPHRLSALDSGLQTSGFKHRASNIGLRL